MKLRLLPRKEIDVLKAKERQTEINEGAKLAKRVDGLRELQAEEEVSLNKWRTETLSSIQMEIGYKLKEKDTLEVQLLNKQREVEEAFEPLRRERKALDAEKETLNLSFIEVELQKANLIEVIQLNGALNALNERELAKRALEKQEYERMFEEANGQLTEAENILFSAQENSKTIRDSTKAIDTQIRKREKTSLEREAQLSTQATLLQQKEAELEQRELDVIVKELQFNSPVHAQHHNSNIS